MASCDSKYTMRHFSNSSADVQDSPIREPRESSLISGKVRYEELSVGRKLFGPLGRKKASRLQAVYKGAKTETKDIETEQRIFSSREHDTEDVLRIDSSPVVSTHVMGAADDCPLVLSTTLASSSVAISARRDTNALDQCVNEKGPRSWLQYTSTLHHATSNAAQAFVQQRRSQMTSRQVCNLDSLDLRSLHPDDSASICLSYSSRSSSETRSYRSESAIYTYRMPQDIDGKSSDAILEDASIASLWLKMDERLEMVHKDTDPVIVHRHALHDNDKLLSMRMLDTVNVALDPEERKLEDVCSQISFPGSDSCVSRTESEKDDSCIVPIILAQQALSEAEDIEYQSCLSVISDSSFLQSPAPYHQLRSASSISVYQSSVLSKEPEEQYLLAGDMMNASIRSCDTTGTASVVSRPASPSGTICMQLDSSSGLSKSLPEYDLLVDPEGLFVAPDESSNRESMGQVTNKFASSRASSEAPMKPSPGFSNAAVTIRDEYHVPGQTRASWHDPTCKSFVEQGSAVAADKVLRRISESRRVWGSPSSRTRRERLCRTRRNNVCDFEMKSGVTHPTVV